VIDKNTKQKIKRFWCVSVCAFVTFSFLIIKARSVLQANQTYNEYKQAFEQASAQASAQASDLISEHANPSWEASQQELEKSKQTLQVYKQASEQADLQSRNFKRELSTLGISALCFIVMLIVLIKQRNRISLSLTGLFICFIPEECVAELEALGEQLKSEHLSTWFIRIIILKNVLELFYAFYIEINIQNLWLFRK
jgi:predicted PurR-regulated permease PerM